MTRPVLSEVDQRGVATVTLNRPEKHNALNEETITALQEIFETFGARQDVRVILLRASGTTFCAGGDLDWMKAQFTATRESRVVQAMALSTMLLTIDCCPKPVVAVVQGNAFGGGVGMMSVADVVISSDEAVFSLSETRLGLVPATISPFVAARITPAHCRSIWLSGDVILTERAHTIGLVTQCVAADDLEEAVERQTKRFLATSPAAVAEGKKLARRYAQPIDDQTLQQTSEMLADLWETADAREGISAFLEKRKPNWPSLTVK